MTNDTEDGPPAVAKAPRLAALSLNGPQMIPHAPQHVQRKRMLNLQKASDARVRVLLGLRKLWVLLAGSLGWQL